MKDIINHNHSFLVGNEKITLSISRVNGTWESKVIEGYTGMGNTYGGKFENLDSYIKKLEGRHTYAHNFFNHGHKSAKALQVKK